MSRRLLAILSVCCAAALGASTVALAHGGSGGHHGVRHARHAEPRFLGVALNGLAQRLDVAPADLRAAVRAVAAERRKARRHDAHRPNLAALKTELATALAAGLGKTPDEILTRRPCRARRAPAQAP